MTTWRIGNWRRSLSSPKPPRRSRAVAALPLPAALLLAALTMTVPLSSPAGAAEANAARQAKQVAPPPVEQLGPNVGAQTTSAAAQVEGLESTVAGWGLSCSTTGDLELFLPYVADALRQGNLIGARSLLQTGIDSITAQANENLVPQSNASQFEAAAGSILTAIPTVGHVPNEFHAVTPISLPADPACPRLASGDGVGSRSQAAGQTSNESAASAGISNDIRLAADEGPCSHSMEAALKIFEGLTTKAVELATEEVPFIGSVVASLVELLWPTAEGCENPTWDEIRTFVTKQINQAVDEKTKSDLDGTLEGLKDKLDHYTAALQSKNTGRIEQEYGHVLTALTLDAPLFRPAVRPWVVLPEYVQIMNLLIAHLKDGIAHGASFGITPEEIAVYKSQLTRDLTAGTKYVPTQIAAAEDSVPRPDKDDPHYTDTVFNNKATVDDALIPGAADPSYYWQFMTSPRTTPIPPDTRILYSPAQGCTVSPQPITPVVTKLPLAHLTVWGNDTAVDAMQATYGISPNPQPRMGQPESVQGLQKASNTQPDGGSWTVGPGAMGYITSAYGHAAGNPRSVGFVFTDEGKTIDTGLLGGRGTTPNFTASFPGEVLGTVTVLGAYDKKGLPYRDRSANCVVFGWRLLSSYGAPRQAVPATWVDQRGFRPVNPNTTCGKVVLSATPPPGYNIAEVTLGGAGGGGSSYRLGGPTAGGHGAEVSAEFVITPGGPVSFVDGCGGATPGHSNSGGLGGAGFSAGGNGGSGKNSNYAGGGGGGAASAFCLGRLTCSIPLAIASGGGGAGGENDCNILDLAHDAAGGGGAGVGPSLTSVGGIIVRHGTNGSDGNIGKGGGGGTDKTPGSGGAGYDGQNGQPGSQDPQRSTGGAGASVHTGIQGGAGGGGGGGDWAGGGGGGDTCFSGGGAAGGGGAGSSSVVASSLAPGSVPQWLTGGWGSTSARGADDPAPLMDCATDGNLAPVSGGCPGYIALQWLSNAPTGRP